MAIWPRLGVLVLLLTSFVSAPAAFPEPIPPGAHVPLDAAAFDVLERRLSNGQLFDRSEGEQVFSVREQMIGVLAYLHMAGRDPLRADGHNASAAALWRAAQNYQSEARYYHAGVTGSSICINLETNAWALAATWQLVVLAPGLVPEASQRLSELLGTVSSALVNDVANGVDVCADDIGDSAVNRHALVVWILLEYASANAGGSLEQSARSDLDRLLLDSFDGAFYHPTQGFYGVTANAQWLLALMRAQERFGSAYEAPRDQVADFLSQRAIVLVDGVPAAVSITRDGEGAALEDPLPSNQLWALYALHQYRERVGALDPPGTVEALLSAVPELFWREDGGGLGPPTGPLQTVDNALAVLFTESPPIRAVSRTGSEVVLVVDDRPQFTFPEPNASGSGRWLATNTVSSRFTVGMPLAGSVTLLYPGSELGGYDFHFPQSGFYATPVVTRAEPTPGTPSSSTDFPGYVHVVESGVAGNVTYALSAFEPIDPLDFAYGGEVTVRVANALDSSLGLPRFVIEIDATRIQVAFVVVNDLLFTSYEAASVPGNVHIPDPHIRLTLVNVVLAPGVNTVRVAYEDLEPPVVQSFGLARDRSGEEPLPGGSQEDPTELLTNERVFAVAQLEDNGLVRSAVVLVHLPGSAIVTETPLEKIEGSDGVYSAQLPRFSSSGQGTVQIRVEDGKGNLKLSTTQVVEVRSSLLAGGSLILFVFTAVLFFTSASIYLKVRRRKPDH